MQKRAFERISVEQSIRFLSGDSLCQGTVENCAENGMYIKTNISFPFESGFEILLPLKNEIIKVKAKVVRLVKTENFYNAMGVELLNPPERYLHFIENLRHIYST